MNNHDLKPKNFRKIASEIVNVCQKETKGKAKLDTITNVLRKFAGFQSMQTLENFIEEESKDLILQNEENEDMFSKYFKETDPKAKKRILLYCSPIDVMKIKEEEKLLSLSKEKNLKVTGYFDSEKFHDGIYDDDNASEICTISEYEWEKYKMSIPILREEYKHYDLFVIRNHDWSFYKTIEG